MALLEEEGERVAPFSEKWQVLHKSGGNLYLMYRQTKKGVAIMPMYVHSFRFVTPHTMTEAERFNLLFPNPERCTHVSDKLRYYRYQNNLFQSDVAEYVGMDRGTYSSYEEYERDYYPIENMQKIAKQFRVPVTELLDDYNLFLYNGQGQQVKKIRKSLHLTQAEFAKIMNVQTGMVKRWEQGKVRMFKGTWESLIKIEF